MKRLYRNDMPQTQKDKIAAAQKNRTKPEWVRKKISDSMTKYWAGLPTKPDTDNPNIPQQPQAPTKPF